MDPNCTSLNCWRALALLVWLTACGASAADRSVPPIEALFLGPLDLPPGWEIVSEAPEDAASDPDLRRAGVRERAARHYTRALGRRAEACSVELWSFADAAHAERGLRMLPRDGARLQRIGPILVSLRCTTLVRESGASEVVSPECAALAGEIAERARRALHLSP
jgi:hypothetical protein